MLVLSENQLTKTEQYRIQLKAHATTQPEGGSADPVTGEVFESLNCSPRQLVPPPSSLPLQPRCHQPHLMLLPPPRLRATSHARSALPYGSPQTSG